VATQGMCFLSLKDPLWLVHNKIHTHTHTHHEPPKINKSNFVNLIFRFIYIAREEFGQSTWDKVSYFKEHMKEHHGKYNEEPMWTCRNSLGRRKNMKSPHPNPKINKNGTLECMFSLSICCMNLFFAKVLITYFGLD